MKKLFLALLFLAAASGTARAAWTTTYEGENTLSLVAEPNSTGSNLRRARIDVRTLPEGSYTQALGALVDKGLQGCAMDDVRKVVMKARGSPDLIGNTTTHLAGPGIYINLPSSGRAGIGNWFLAPYYSIEVSLSGENGPLESFNLFEFDSIILQGEPMTQESFMRTKDDDLVVAIVGFARKTLPDAVKKALPKRCKG